FGRNLEEIHVTWTQFEKKRDKIATLHEDDQDLAYSLPSSNEKTVIFVVVNRFSKYAHFIPLSHPFTAAHVAQVFFDNVYKLHGLPKIIVSDRDKVFLSMFWKELFKALQVSLHLTTAYHPYSDGQTEVFYLDRAQQRMKAIVDAKRIDREFAVGQWVYLKLQPHRQVFVRMGKYNKLNQKYYGPFQVVQRLKKYKGLVSNAPAQLPICNAEGEIVSVPVKVLDRKLGRWVILLRSMFCSLVKWNCGRCHVGAA
ncbi:retrotransposable element Tf2, partial [Tanacetum coccineum]